MKRNLKQGLCTVLATAAMCLLLAGCRTAAPQPDPQNPLQGQWRDTYGLTQYTFLDEKNLVLTALGMAEFSGTYQINPDHSIQISYSVLGIPQSHTYALSLSENRMFLDKNEFVRTP